MNENEAIVIGIGIMASLVGLLEFGRRTILETAQERAQLNNIIELLGKMNKIEGHLEDVLSHPDDSGFGVGQLAEDVAEMKQIVINIEHNQLDHLGYIKNGIERIEAGLGKLKP